MLNIPRLQKVTYCKLFDAWKIPIGMAYRMRYGLLKSLYATKHHHILPALVLSVCEGCPVNKLSAKEVGIHWQEYNEYKINVEKVISANVIQPIGRRMRSYKTIEQELVRTYPAYRKIYHCKTFQVWHVRHYKLVTAVCNLMTRIRGNIREVCNGRKCQVCWNNPPIACTKMYDEARKQKQRLRRLIANYENKRYIDQLNRQMRRRSSPHLSQAGSDIR